MGGQMQALVPELFGGVQQLKRISVATNKKLQNLDVTLISGVMQGSSL